MAGFRPSPIPFNFRFMDRGELRVLLDQVMDGCGDLIAKIYSIAQEYIMAMFHAAGLVEKIPGLSAPPC